MDVKLNQNWQPATFRERGVAVGFTGPMLVGARVRYVEQRHELVVPHPGGVRGVYIFTLGAMAEFAKPTLHDIYLARRLAVLNPLTPSTVRLAARAIAEQGPAGRVAAAAASAAAKLDALRSAAFEAALKVALAAVGTGGTPGAMQRSEAVRILASRGAATAEAMCAHVKSLADELASAGLDPPPGTLLRTTDQGRCARLLDGLAVMAREIRPWAAQSDDRLGVAQLVGAVETVLLAGRVLLEAAQAQVLDLPGLLAGWATTPELLTGRITRTEWLLDGWEKLCLRWQLAQSEDQKAEALADIVPRVPPMPREAEAWFAGRPDLQARLRDWQPGFLIRRRTPAVPSGVVDQVARNERLGAMAQ